MKFLPPYPSGKVHRGAKSRSGFTLVELMVSITILIIMVLLFGQLLATTSRAWTYGHSKANNFTKARAMLDLLAQDIQSGVFRPDLAAFPSGSTGTGGSPPVWEFYTSRPGIPASANAALRSVSVVAYKFVGPTNPNNGIPNTIERADSPVLWGDPDSNIDFGSTTSFTLTPTQRDTAPGVIAFEVIFVQSDGTFSPTYTPLSTGGVANANPTRAVSITLAVIDDSTVPKLSSTQLTALNTALTGQIPATPTHSIKSYWDSYLNGTTMAWNSYPQGLGNGLATFERYVSLPNAP